VVKSRVHKNIVIMKLEGIDTVEQADAMRNKVIFINRRDAQLPEGRYFVQDLIGLRVINAATGETIGELADVYNTVANDVYSVRVGGKEYLIPAIDEVLAGTDLEAGTVAINVMKGMFDDED
ncbi:MAG: 16S rRNA processing protein RimM, partial [Ruminococcaceae bacterium]|nr:16S rRNA processing protein RimM [Oscillospiraceae bacterium]